LFQEKVYTLKLKSSANTNIKKHEKEVRKFLVDDNSDILIFCHSGVNSNSLIRIKSVKVFAYIDYLISTLPVRKLIDPDTASVRLSSSFEFKLEARRICARFF